MREVSALKSTDTTRETFTGRCSDELAGSRRGVE